MPSPRRKYSDRYQTANSLSAPKKHWPLPLRTLARGSRKSLGGLAPSDYAEPLANKTATLTVGF